MSHRARTLLGVLLIAIATAIALNDSSSHDAPAPAATTTVTAPAPVGDLQPEPEPAHLVGEPEASLRDEHPDEIPARVLEQGRRVNQTVSEARLGPALPVGGAQNYSCRQDFSGHVYSERNGQKPTEFVLHYTVSANRPGWSDVLAIQAYFKRTRIASAHYIVDFEGHCLQMVPLPKKSWTQGAANPTSISVEVIATGRETTAQWLAAPLFTKRILASIARDAMRGHGIPLRWVDPVGCVFGPGWTDHNALECGNDHHDMTPNFPYKQFAAQLVDGPRIDKHARRRCNALNWQRAQAHKDGYWKPRRVRRARYLKHKLREAGVTCRPKR